MNYKPLQGRSARWRRKHGRCIMMTPINKHRGIVESRRCLSYSNHSSKMCWIHRKSIGYSEKLKTDL